MLLRPGQPSRNSWPGPRLAHEPVRLGPRGHRPRSRQLTHPCRKDTELQHAARQRLIGRPTTIYPGIDEAVAHKHRAMPGLSLEAARILTLRGIERGADGRCSWRHDPRLRGPSLMRLTEEQVRAYLRRVVCPVLVVRPRDGWPADEAEVRGRLACLTDVELLEVDGEHHVHLDHPGRFAARALAFLRG